jgi:hypothetical protein
MESCVKIWRSAIGVKLLCEPQKELAETNENTSSVEHRPGRNPTPFSRSQLSHPLSNVSRKKTKAATQHTSEKQEHASPGKEQSGKHQKPERRQHRHHDDNAHMAASTQIHGQHRRRPSC